MTYEFLLGTYATAELAKKAIENAINEQAVKVQDYRIYRGASIEWNEGKNVVRYRLDMTTFEY